ncbi:aldo/keto reductase [Nocardioides bruguierae]|nr:aldo/keto reductase [Nocardioides bruguierae]
MQVPQIMLPGDVAMPQLGYGVWQIADDEAETAVATAIETGYRHIDTASAYGNEKGVGLGLKKSGLPREDLFVVTKLWNDAQGYESTLAAFEESRTKLATEYVDLYLIHWPIPSKALFVDTWKACEKLLADGVVRAIGVSNFQPAHLETLAQETGTVPAVNQVESHPMFRDTEIDAYGAEHGIVTEAWSPLGQGGVLTDPTLTAIAAEHGRSVAQVVLRWHLDSGRVAIPKSVTPSRIAENIDLDFVLTSEQLAAIDWMNTGERIGPDPLFFGSDA